MKIIETEFPGLLLIEPDVFKDDRGYFYESYNKKTFERNNVIYEFIQDNQSKSTFGVHRGLYYQLAPYAQTKLIRVLFGEIFDVAVDIRKNSPSYGQWFGIKLSEVNQKQLLIPKGFAHGFSVLSKEAVILYKCDDYYNKNAERGIIFNDSSLKIDWQIDSSKAIISAKDKVLPEFNNAEMNFYYNEI